MIERFMRARGIFGVHCKVTPESVLVGFLVREDEQSGMVTLESESGRFYTVNIPVNVAETNAELAICQ